MKTVLINEEPKFIGNTCKFYSMGLQPNECFGIKVYDDNKLCYVAYHRQKLASSKGIAPPVGEMIKVGDSFYDLFGYETGICDTDTPVKLDEKFHELMKKIIEENPGPIDLCLENLGYYNNKLVLLDFGIILPW